MVVVVVVVVGGIGGLVDLGYPNWRRRKWGFKLLWESKERGGVSIRKRRRSRREKGVVNEDGFVFGVED